MTTTISQGDENLLRALKDQLNEQMTRAAEPLLQKALKEMEEVMRKRLAQVLVEHIESSFSMQRMGRDLVITVRR